MKKIISFVLCAVMVCTSAALFAGCGSGSGSGSSENKGEVNVYNWGDYVANGMDGLKDVVAEFEKGNRHQGKLHYLRYQRGALQYAQEQQRRV